MKYAKLTDGKDPLAHFANECIKMRKVIQDGHLSKTNDILVLKAHLLALMNDLLTMLTCDLEVKEGAYSYASQAVTSNYSTHYRNRSH
jgi:hypothetical protein